MAVVEKNWQTTRPTIKERNMFMFNNDLFSDVKFVVRKTDGESESKQVIPAHKFVLSISSPVFEAMFYGELAETGDSIELPDCEYESLLEMFRYMYSDEAILSGIVARDTLTIEEIELFKAVDLWATKECERQGLEADGAIKRRVLGEEVIKGIRFPTMKQEDFAGLVLDSEILKPKEVVSIIKHLSSVASCPVGFPETKRSGLGGDIQRCCRFGSLEKHFRYTHGDGIYDAIKFSVDKDIELHGVCLFGGESNTYSVELKLTEVTSKTVLVFQTGQLSSELLRCEKYSYYGFEVLFDKKITLMRNTTYEIWAKIIGPDSVGGRDGISSVKRRGVTFTFIEAYP
ncbi:hypothetical protein ACROYT_G008745 [Oculina patagonica]